jgi:hypothetical protein
MIKRSTLLLVALMTLPAAGDTDFSPSDASYRVTMPSQWRVDKGEHRPGHWRLYLPETGKAARVHTEVLIEVDKDSRTPSGDEASTNELADSFAFVCEHNHWTIQSRVKTHVGGVYAERFVYTEPGLDAKCIQTLICSHKQQFFLIGSSSIGHFQKQQAALLKLEDSFRLR